MALQKQFIKPNGIETNYHRISQASLTAYDNEDSHSLFVALTSYLSEEYRNAGYEVETNHYHFQITDGEDTTMGIRELAYKKLKELPEWADAVDC